MTLHTRGQHARARLAGAVGAWQVIPWRRFGRTAAVALAGLALTGCALVDKPVRPVAYDFGPGLLAIPAANPANALVAVVLPEVESVAALDTTAVLYRLAYADAQQLTPYAQARWSMTAAQLVHQRLRETLGQRRVVLNPADGNVVGVVPPLVLHVEVEEFSQVFDAPGNSFGLVRLHVTVLRGAQTTDKLLGQRSFVAQRPAPSADAAGGVHALAAASTALAQEIEQWLTQFR